MYCEQCGSKIPADVDFCIMCGVRLNQPHTIHTPVQKKRSNKKWILSFIAIGLVVIISTTLILIKLSGSNEGNAPFTQELTKGFTISGEENVLDKERTFTAEPLSEEAFTKVANNYVFNDRLLMEAFEFDAGMTAEEQLPGKVKLEFNLEELGFPENIRPFIRVERIADDGTAEELVETLEGNSLICYTDKNSVLTLSILLGLVTTAGIIHDRKDSDLLMKSEYSGVDFYSTDKVLPGYSISWPVTMDFGNPKEVDKEFQKIKKLYDEYKIDEKKGITDSVIKNIAYDSGSNLKEAIQAFAIRMYQEPDFEEAMKKFQDEKWQQKNVWPAPVQYTIMALKKVDPYLYGSKVEGNRGLSRPRFKIKMMILNPWPYDNSDYAYVVNPKTASPVMQVNATSLPSQTRLFKSKTQDAIKRELYTTLSHELFHVTQMGYINIDWNSYQWFWEATATVFEDEAADFFASKGEINDSNEENMNTIFYDTLSSSIGLQSQWGKKDYGSSGYEEFLRKQGYTASRFLAFMRDEYYKSNRNDFIYDLLLAFRKQKDYYLALRKAINMTDEELVTAFRQYCYKDTPRLKKYTEAIWSAAKKNDPKTFTFYNLIEKNQYELSDKSPYVKVTTRYNPISFHLKSFDVKLNDTSQEKTKLVIKLKDEEIAKSLMTWRVSSDGSKFSMFEGEQYRIIDNVKTNKYYVEEIHGYLESAKGVGEESTYEAFLMTAPEAPTITKENEKLVVKIPKTVLQEKGVISYVNVYLVTPDGEECSFTTKTGELEIPLDGNGNIDSDSSKYKDIPLGDEFDYEAMQRAAERLQGGVDKKYVVWITEVIETDKGDKIVGPASKEVDHTEKAEVFTGNIVGVWSGNCLGAGNITVTISNGSDGHDYDITISLYDDMVLHGDDNGDGTIAVSGGFGTSIIVNSEKELYLAAPPTTLHKN